MKTQKFLLSGILGLAVAGLILNGCHKDTATAPVTNTNQNVMAAEDDANGTYASNDSKNIADASMQSQSASGSADKEASHKLSLIYGDCAKVTGNDTIVGGAQDTVIHIEFGTTDCFCFDKRNRRGTIIVYWGLQHPGESWFQAYSDSGNTITLTFKDYYLRDNGISGTRTWTNEGHNVNGYQNWNFTANLTITYPNSQTATWVAARNNAITQVDNVWYYEVSGNGHGMARDGNSYTVTIASPIYVTVLPWWAGGCPWPEAGIVTITRTSPAGGNSVTMTVNYGTLGDCNANKTVTVSGSTQTIAMW